MNFAKLDSNMSGKNIDIYKQIANKHGYKYINEMFYDLHVNQGYSFKSMSEFFTDNSDQIISTESVHGILKHRGWINKKAKHVYKSKVKKKMCSCCGRKPVATGFRFLCGYCYTQGEDKGTYSGRYDSPVEEHKVMYLRH